MNINDFKLVPAFQYTGEFATPLIGDEWYEILYFDEDGVGLQDTGDNLTQLNFPNTSILEAIDGIRTIKRHAPGDVHALVVVYGQKYPDGSPVPNGSAVWDSRTSEWPADANPGYIYTDGSPVKTNERVYPDHKLTTFVLEIRHTTPLTAEAFKALVQEKLGYEVVGDVVQGKQTIVCRKP